ncbi:ABC transporter substrate-binding protein [Actinosynnema pretiosum subsp. pretiosum]
MAVLVVVLVAGIASVVPQWTHRWSCRDGLWPDREIWEAGGKCVGLSGGPYAFDEAAFEPAMKVAEQQNGSAERDCGSDSRPAVTVGVLLTMTDPMAGTRAVQELEGILTGQARANGEPDCLQPIKVLVGNLGDYGGDGDPVAVATALAEHPSGVVAVVGIGLSDVKTARVANALAERKIPMVSDLITAEGFDQGTSGKPKPDFSACSEEGREYRDGIGKSYYYRVAFPGSVQMSALHKVLPARLDFILVPLKTDDPYTCTALPLMRKQFGGAPKEIKFDTEEPQGVELTKRAICAEAGDITVGYLARGRDLAGFLRTLDEAFSRGLCQPSSVTVVSTSDGQRVRAKESDVNAERLRQEALTSNSFTSGRIKLVTALVGGADQTGGSTSGRDDFAKFAKAFAAAHGLEERAVPEHVDAGWAVNGHDAMKVVAEAVHALPKEGGRRAGVNGIIGSFISAELSVLGAGGPIMFDNDGNRTGDAPPVVRVCPEVRGPDKELGRVKSVVLTPGKPLPDCP